jgi:hypothetical protein
LYIIESIKEIKYAKTNPKKNGKHIENSAEYLVKWSGFPPPPCIGIRY